MYWKRSQKGLSRADLEAARLGFLGYLRRKRFSPQFIERNAEDLFGQACLEYSRKLAAGEEIENPPGWLIECAWRRTKSKLEAEKAAPRVVSTEKTAPVRDEPDRSPENVLLDADRMRKVREAVGQLSLDERRLLALSYFEGFTVREAARRLRWHSSKAQRTDRRARRQLYELLGVQSSDELEHLAGLACYLSLAQRSGWRPPLPAGVDAFIDAAGRTAADAVGRAQDLVRRLLLGGAAEPSGAAVAAGAARTATVCGAAALACLAAGVVGPGGGGPLGVISGGSAQPDEAPRSAVAGTPAVIRPSAWEMADSHASRALIDEVPLARKESRGDGSAGDQPDGDAHQARKQFDGFARAAAAKSPPASPTSAATTSSLGSVSPSAGTESAGSASVPPPAVQAEEAQAESEFGAFK